MKGFQIRIVSLLIIFSLSLSNRLREFGMSTSLWQGHTFLTVKHAPQKHKISSSSAFCWLKSDQSKPQSLKTFILSSLFWQCVQADPLIVGESLLVMTFHSSFQPYQRKSIYYSFTRKDFLLFVCKERNVKKNVIGLAGKDRNFQLHQECVVKTWIQISIN